MASLNDFLQKNPMRTVFSNEKKIPTEAKISKMTIIWLIQKY